MKDSSAKVYFELLEGPKTVEDISVLIGRDRSVAQRYLKELVDSNLAITEKVSLDQGGYRHIYVANPSEEVKSQILQQLDDWYNETRRFLLDSWPTQN